MKWLMNLLAKLFPPQTYVIMVYDNEIEMGYVETDAANATMIFNTIPEAEEYVSGIRKPDQAHISYSILKLIKNL